MRGNCCAIQAVRYVIHALVLFYYYFDFFIVFNRKIERSRRGFRKRVQKGGSTFCLHPFESSTTHGAIVSASIKLDVYMRQNRKITYLQGLF